MTYSNPIKISVFSYGGWGEKTPMKCFTNFHYCHILVPKETLEYSSHPLSNSQISHSKTLIIIINNKVE